MRLMPTGLAYLREIGMKVVNDEILRIQLPTITEVVEAGQASISCFLLLWYPEAKEARRSPSFLHPNGVKFVSEVKNSCNNASFSVAKFQVPTLKTLL